MGAPYNVQTRRPSTTSWLYFAFWSLHSLRIFLGNGLGHLKTWLLTHGQLLDALIFTVWLPNWVTLVLHTLLERCRLLLSILDVVSLRFVFLFEYCNIVIRVFRCVRAWVHFWILSRYMCFIQVLQIEVDVLFFFFKLVLVQRTCSWALFWRFNCIFHCGWFINFSI